MQNHSSMLELYMMKSTDTIFDDVKCMVSNFIPPKKYFIPFQKVNTEEATGWRR